MGELITVGWWEWAQLPGLHRGRLKAKCDTGARSSALHAEDIVETLAPTGQAIVEFRLSPDGDLLSAPLREHRTVKSSNGATEVRPVVLLTVSVARRVFPVNMALTTRSFMSCPVLLGRDALADRFVVDSSRAQYCSGSRRVR